ncbi:hypothetical protein ACVWZ8_001189 [Arthrobacter sp. UYCu723]
MRRGKPIQAIDPRTMVQLSDSPSIRDVANDADDADARLRAALAALSGAGTSEN